MASVDVIVPCYKYGHFLRACVESVLRQPGVDVRVLILDDASPDQTPQVGAELANEDSRVQYRRHEANRGHIETYNEGLAWASADYCLLLSADDMLTPGALRRAASVLDRHSDVGLTFGKRILWAGDALPSEGLPIPDGGARVIRGSEFLEAVCSTAYNPVCTPTAIVRTAVQKAIGGYRPQLPHTGDLEMWLRFAANGAVGLIDAEQAYWRLHGRNMRKQYRGTDNIRQHQAAFDSFFREYGERIDGSRRLRRLAYRHMAEAAFWSADHCFDEGKLEPCEQLLALAVELDPQIRSWGAWARFRYKRLLGVTAWITLRPLVSLLRRARRAIGARPRTPAEAAGFDIRHWHS